MSQKILKKLFKKNKNIFMLLENSLNKLKLSDVAIHLNLPYISGWVWFKGLDFHFFSLPQFGRLVFGFLVFCGPTD